MEDLGDSIMEEHEGTTEEKPPFLKLSARKRSWSDLFVLFINMLRKKNGPLFTVKVGFGSVLGCFVSGTLSHFVGNDIWWNIFHFFTSWFYTAYKIVEKVSPLLQG